MIALQIALGIVCGVTATALLAGATVVGYRLHLKGKAQRLADSVRASEPEVAAILDDRIRRGIYQDDQAILEAARQAVVTNRVMDEFYKQATAAAVPTETVTTKEVN